MRRGTHSCYECRRRKVRCIFTKDSAICESCAARGKRCTEQRRELLQAAAIDTRESLRERVARLEAIIQASSSDGGSVAVDQISGLSKTHPRDTQPDGLATESSSSSIASNPTPASIASPNVSVSIDKDSPQNIDPLVTLFDNAIWRRHSSDFAQERSSKGDEARNPVAATKRIRTRESLLSGFIPPELLGMILNATCSWWHTWRPLGPWLLASIGDREKNSTLQDFTLWAFNSSDPSIVGLAMLCVAVCLQQLDTRVHQYIIRQLPRLPGELFQEYFEKVDRLIINDSDYASTEEGIEATILSAKIYMNLGLNRKCWVLFHRAIAYSQLLGFHRPERISAAETEVERYRRNQSWLSLCSGDVYTSLLLGLPYAADGRTIPVMHNQHNATSLLKHNLILLSAKVIDRNQMGLSLSVSRTEEIQRELEAAMKDLDETFWNSPAALADGRITRQEYLERIAAQCWLYQILVLLHMPLMIHSVEDAQLEKYRTACLDACRNLLKIYHIMRSDPYSAFDMVKLIDYQAFVCSALLILGLLGYGGSTYQAANKDKDRDLISLAITTLRQASGTVNNPIASQAVQGLETLMSLDRREQEHKPGNACVGVYARIVVPHIGTITISPGEYITNSRPEFSSPNYPLPVFALSHDIVEGSSSLANQPPTLASSGDFDSGQANGLEFDFDWTSTITPNFEDDWAWLNDLNY
ncbi:hypothetical protein EG329_009944 [Mollisiaceae sp. DMI_Dod_QoI]|nr:hypothetical protein EG329_009944 [Helotiales sp. DMI_Dod_QoI]